MENNNRELGIKDLITIGVFIAIIQVAVLIGGTPFAVVPTLTFFFPIGAALLPGPAYLLMIAKVQKRGAVTIMGIVGVLIGFATGMHWAMYIGGLIAAIVADFVAGLRKYKSKKINIISYIIYCLGSMGTYIAFYINPRAWTKTMLSNGTPIEYIEKMQSVVNMEVMGIMFFGTIIIAMISGLIGSKLLKKQFEKAGITS